MKRTILAITLLIAMLFCLAPKVSAGETSHRVICSVSDEAAGSIRSSHTSAEAGESIVLSIAVNPGYKLKLFQATYGGGDGAYREYLGRVGNEEVFAVTMPDAELTVHAVFTPAEAHPITAEVRCPEGGTLTVSHDSAREGEIVSVTAHPGQGYTIGGFTCSAASLTRHDHCSWTFVMPDHPVELSIEFLPYASPVITVVETGLGGTVTVDRQEALPGETVTVTCQPQEGYRLADISGPEGLTSVGDDVYTFPMPGGDYARIRVLFLRLDNPFLDVNETHYFYEPVLWAVEAGITNGISHSEFGPGFTISRAAAITMLWRRAGCPNPAAETTPFADVPADAYYARAVAWAVETGITTGVSGSAFDPCGVCTRAQVVTFLWRAAGAPEAGDAGSGFDDVASGCYYARAVAWAVEKGITTGTDSSHFSPDAPAQRAQFVTFLYRADTGRHST